MVTTSSAVEESQRRGADPVTRPSQEHENRFIAMMARTIKSREHKDLMAHEFEIFDRRAPGEYTPRS